MPNETLTLKAGTIPPNGTASGYVFYSDGEYEQLQAILGNTETPNSMALVNNVSRSFRFRRKRQSESLLCELRPNPWQHLRAFCSDRAKCLRIQPERQQDRRRYLRGSRCGRDCPCRKVWISYQ